MGCIHSRPGDAQLTPAPSTGGEEILRSIDSAVPRFLKGDGGDQFLDEDLADDIGSPTQRSNERSLEIAFQPELLSPAMPRSVKETFQLKVGVLEGTTFLNDYVVVDTLGRGSHGKVKLCLNVVDNHLYAVKIVETAAITKQAKTRLARKSLRATASKQSTASFAENGEFSVDPSRSSKSTVYSQERSSSLVDPPTPLNQRTSTSTLGASPFGPGSSRLETASTMNTMQVLEQEADVMKALNHPNLVRLYEVIRSDSGKLLMVMEYCHAGPLVDENGRFSHCQEDIPEIIVHHFFKQMTSAIQYLHAEGIVHGDIKPENMLLSGDGTVKIADFGQSLKILQDKGVSSGRHTSKLTRTLGTPAYLAPEICAGEEYDGFSADVWALGVTLYSFMFGKLPFEGKTVVDLYDTIAEKEVEFPEGRALSIELQDLFLRLLHKNPKYRITAEELIVHPWVARSDSELLDVEQMFEDDSHLPPEFRVLHGGSPVGSSPKGPSPKGSSPKGPPPNSLQADEADDVSDDGQDGEIGPDPDAVGLSTSKRDAQAARNQDAGRCSPKSADDQLEDRDTFGVSVMRSLSYIARERNGRMAETSGMLKGTTNVSAAAAGSESSAPGNSVAQSGASSISAPSSELSPAMTTLEEFNTIADQLLRSQKSILASRSRKGTSSASTTAKLSHLSMKEPSDREITPQHGDPLVVEHINLVTSDGSSSTMAIPSKSPFDIDPEEKTLSDAVSSMDTNHARHDSVVEGIEDAMRTADEVPGAALMHFEAGEYIDGFGFDNQHFAYYIDSGKVDIRYMADLPVPFDEIVGGCLEDVIVSHFSADLTNADSVCYTENPSSFVFKRPRREVSSLFPSMPSLHVLQTMFERLVQGGTSSSAGVNSNDLKDSLGQFSPDEEPKWTYRDSSVHRFVDQSERAMSLAHKGNLGDLLTSTRTCGQFIGALSLLDPDYFQNKWTFSAVATTDLVVIKMNKEALQKFLMVHPLSQISLRASMSRTVSDLVKLEMYERISLARRRLRDTSKLSSSSSAFSAANQGFEEVAKHLTETALAGAEILAKLDLFALASRLREDAQSTLGFKKTRTFDENANNGEAVDMYEI